jgi:putative peptidoglycan lipid II flippase
MATDQPKTSQKSFVHHARLIGGLTLFSRVLGLARDVVATHFLGAELVASAFSVAFTIPNLFRKLLGEGALSQAFIPLYAQAVQRGKTDNDVAPAEFAAASVRLLAIILIAITVIGEIILIGLIAWTHHSEKARQLTLMMQFAAVMLPYVMLVCGGAFLSAILQVHKRFGAPAFAPVLLNVVHIIVVVLGAWFLGLHGKEAVTPRVEALQTQLAFYLAFGVLIAGVLQVMVLMPALRQIGFTWSFHTKSWIPDTRRMLLMSIPVAIGAGVLQTSVLLDKAISYALMQGGTRENPITHFSFFGHVVRYPMELGATRRLELAQLMYQFPLGIFAIALATAIFPRLSALAAETDRTQFKQTCRQGIEATLWEGLPASVGLILVADPAVRLLFQHGQLPAHHASLIAWSTMFYAGGIWAYSLLQVINRAYYALHDTRTPLYASVVNIVVNLVVELPLVWWMGEAGMAVGTLISFSIQAAVMLWMLDRRIGGLGLRASWMPVARMLIATAVMAIVCIAVKHSPLYPTGDTRWTWALQLALVTGIGAAVYLGTGWALGSRAPKLGRSSKPGNA